jgi:hypothetical protein
MTSVVAPAKDQPTSQQEGRFKESFPGVSTLPLDEVRGQGFSTENQGCTGCSGEPPAMPTAWQDAQPAARLAPALQVKARRYGETEKGEV